MPLEFKVLLDCVRIQIEDARIDIILWSKYFNYKSPKLSPGNNVNYRILKTHFVLLKVY